MSGWKGLSAELAEVEQSDPAIVIGRPATQPPAALRTEPAAAPPASRSAIQSQQPRRRSRGADSFVARHRMVGIYFPHQLDEAFRLAAEQDGVSNSEYVAEAVRQRLQAEGRL